MNREKLNVGMIGFGARGTLLLRDIILPLGKADIKSVCDSYEDRAEKAADQVEEVQGKRPTVTLDYHEVIADPEVDTVIITCAWEDHIARKGSRYGSRRSIYSGTVLGTCADL